VTAVFRRHSANPTAKASIDRRVNVDLERTDTSFVEFNTSLFYSNAVVTSYSGTAAYDSTGNSITINGKQAYCVTAIKQSSLVEPNLGGVYYYALDERDDPLIGLLGKVLNHDLHGHFRSGFMLGVGVSAGSGQTIPNYKIGYSLFLDRSLSSALTIGYDDDDVDVGVLRRNVHQLRQFSQIEVIAKSPALVGPVRINTGIPFGGGVLSFCGFSPPWRPHPRGVGGGVRLGITSFLILPADRCHPQAPHGGEFSMGEWRTGDGASESRGVLERASQAHANGQPDRCERLCREVLLISPGEPTASFLLGVSLLRLARLPECIEVLSGLCSLSEPESGEQRAFLRGVELYLSIALRRSKDPSEALRHAERAAELRNDAETISNLGLCLIDAAQYSDAEFVFKKMIEMAPRAPFGYHGLGTCYQRQGRRREALPSFETAAKLTPPGTPALVEIAEALAELDNWPAAAAAAERAHAVAPSVRTHLLLANTALQTGSADAAEGNARQALRIDPESASAWALLGLAQQSKGDREGSDRSFRRSVALQPSQATAWHGLMQNGNASAEAADALEGARRTEGMPEENLSLLDYALGTCYERTGRFEEAFVAYSEANAIAHRVRFGESGFDPVLYRQALTEASSLTVDWTRRLPPLSEGPRPIFVVGMIRSGTTLIEQILSCHPEIGAGGEQTFWLENWRSCVKRASHTIDYDLLRDLRERYLETLSNTSPGDRYVTDKMPLNFAIAGVLALAFPEAPIIHTMRDPRDNCFSIFATAIRSRPEFMQNVESIWSAYGEYRRLMSRWHALLPGRILDLSYEALVSDQQATTLSMLSHCGVDWNESCLHPERNERPAPTPSVAQVKSPVNRSSVGRAAPFGVWLRDKWSEFDR
jgi:tetratricopeptide (TPR) repeat protein